MKKIFTLLFLSFSLTFLAQGPVVEGTYLPVVGTSVKQVWDTASPLPIPTGGPNQVWDYSNQFVNKIDTFQIKTFLPSTVPTRYNKYFPNATHASFLRTPFTNPSDSLYSFFIIDYNGLHNIGGFNIKSIYDTTLIMSRSELLVPEVGTYGMMMYDTSKYVSYTKFSSFNVEIRGRKTKIMQGYGYGTLKMPNGIFGDVLLAKENISVIDSVFVDFTNTGNYTYFNRQLNNYIAYAFVRNNTFGSSYLMHLTANATNTLVDFGWYALPVDIGYISGRVYDKTNVPVTQGNSEAYLYRENSNFAKNDILDKSPVDANGYYQFDSIPYGTYRVAIRPDTASAIQQCRNALITYYGDTTDWITATPIITTTNSIGNDIYLRYHSQPVGAGTINGQIGLNLSIAKVAQSNPVPGIGIVIKKNPGSGAHRNTITTSTGSFSLGVLDDGTYDLFVDIPGLHMSDTYTFTVSGGTIVNGLDFVVGTDSIHPINSLVTSVQEVIKKEGILNAYPNPFNGSTTINLNLTQQSNVVLEAYNVLGEKVQTLYNGSKPSGNYEFLFNTKILNHAAGMYIIKLTTADKTHVLKLIEQ